MPLAYCPNPGEILVCHYDDVPIEPEMRKARPAVVVTPRLRGRGRLVTVVPFSTTSPVPQCDYHCEIVLERPLPPPFDKPSMWAKCDMIAAVSLDRLDRFKEPKSRYGGARKWVAGRVSDAQLADIRRAVLCGMGFATLTKHL